MRSRRGGAVVVVAAAALTLPGAALAHAQLSRSTPADRAVLAAAPREARFAFDDSVRPASGIKAVRNGGASVLAGKPHVVRGRTLVVPLRQQLGNGDYTVLWRVISDDGHEISGVIAFAVGAGRAPPTPSLTAGNGPATTDVISRFLFLAGILIAGGGSLFRLVVGVGRERVLLGGFLLAFLGGTGMLGHHASLSTRFGLAVAIATVVAAFGATAAGISLVEPVAGRAAWVFGLLLLPAPSFAGHALDPGRPRIEVLVDVLHIVAAAAWFGGLVQLAFVLRHDPDSGRRFSLLGLGAVIALSATGVARAFAELDAVSQVWTTGYGRLLIVKTALLALLVSLGWINRYRLLPRGALRAFAGTVRVEILLLAGLTVAVALLTDTRPGRDRTALAALPPEAPALPQPNAFVVGGEDGDRAVTLAIDARRVRATVIGPDGSGVDGLTVNVAGRPTGSCGPGCYEAQTTPPRRRVSVSVDGRTLVLPAPTSWPPQPAARLVARATRTFERLASVSYVERLASSPRNRIVSDFTLEAPSRFSYRIHGGPSAVVIGGRRWDRVRAGPWDETPYSSLPQPTPIWEGRITNAFILRQTGRATTVTFLNRRAPAWFTVRLSRQTTLPRELEMTATAHFMQHRYFGFDAPRQIFPPTTRR
jgi:copper transport protein